MSVYKLNPLTDPRWPEFLTMQPRASIFHTREWLDALRKTYGYEPVAFTTSEGAELSNGLVFCEVRSWLTGRRLVSLPFSDHCQPLASGRDLKDILEFLHGRRGADSWKYIELRPVSDVDLLETPGAFGNSEAFRFQNIDLQPDLDTIYRRFHDSCVRRKIKRAEREGLRYEAGRSPELLQKFLQLLLLTRRRHKLPPQPDMWFRNLVACLGEALTISLLSKDAEPVASILTLAHGKSVVYKYGCSDARFNNLGGTPLLFWKAVQQAKQMGAEVFDLGRSAMEDPGLTAFKEHLGGITTELRYYRSPAPVVKKDSSNSAAAWAREALARLPDALLVGAGRLIYRHLG